MICHSFLVSSDIFSEFETKDLIKRVGNFEIQTFDDFKKGQDWILEKLK